MKKVIELDEAEIQALVQLMDAGVKHLGLAAAKNAAVLLAKLEAAPKVEPQTEEPV